MNTLSASANITICTRRPQHQTDVYSISWDSAASFWKFETNRNDNIRGKWIVPAAGPLSLPKFPGLAGLEKFQGHSFHSSRWDYAYTGGDSLGNLTNLADKRVGIIGTGATAVQLVPHLGKHAKELYVFQRTPSSIDARNNRPTDPKWVESSTRGWQQSRMDNFHSLVNGEAQAEDLVSDGWTDILRTLGGVATIQPGIDENPIALAARLQIADLKKMEYLRARVDQIVTNAETAEGLKPWYNTFFKRPCFHDAYLPTFNRLKVNLVDTKGRGIDAITERGIIANGKETELYCIIYVTGFEFASDWIDRTGTEIYGQDGTSLTQKWRSGVSTFHGWSVQNFPNCLLIITSQAGSSPNYIHNANEQACHLAYLLSYCEKHGIKTIQPTIKSEAAWVKEVLEMGKPRTNFLKECTPGYCNDEGKANEKLTRDLPYGGAGLKYLEILKKWRDDERLEGLECTYV